jgi:hypothetical protein
MVDLWSGFVPIAAMSAITRDHSDFLPLPRPFSASVANKALPSFDACATLA